MKDKGYHPTLSVIRKGARSVDRRDRFIQEYDGFIDTSDFECVELYFRDMASRFFKEGFKAGYQQAVEEKDRIS